MCTDRDHENEFPLSLRPPRELKEIMAAAVEHQCFVSAAGTIVPFQPIADGITQGITRAVMILSHAGGGHDEKLAECAGLVGKVTGLCEGYGIEVNEDQHQRIIDMEPEALRALLSTLRTTKAFPPDFADEAESAAGGAAGFAADAKTASSPGSAPDLEQTKAAVLIAQMVGFCDAAGIDFPQDKRLEMQTRSVDELVALYAALKVQRSFPAELGQSA